MIARADPAVIRPADLPRAAAYYCSPANNVRLYSAARMCLGTPFGHKGRAPGPRGALDCVTLCHAVQVCTGWMEPIPPHAMPDYALDESVHCGESKLRACLEAFGLLARGVRVDTLEGLRSGDVLCFRVGRSFYHLGQMVGSHHFLHVLRGGVVRYEQITHPVVKEWFIEAWRPLSDLPSARSHLPT